jgi:hypothetical protein
MSAATPLPKKPIHRFRTHRSYDKSLGKTPGLVYAPHNPKTAEIIDRLEFLRNLRKLCHEGLARLIVAAYQERNPDILVKGNRININYPEWERLPQEAKALMYATSADSIEFPLTHYATIHLDDLNVAERHWLGQGPIRIIGDLINKKLAKIYNRAGEAFEYLYILETAPLYENDESGKRLDQRSDLDSFHVSLALRIPDSIHVSVLKALARFGRMPVESLYQYHSGCDVHLAHISNERQFDRGGDQTGRSGLLGRSDYAAKGLRKLYETRRFYNEHAVDPLPLNKWTHASGNIRAQAMVDYSIYRNDLTYHPELAWHDAISFLPGDYDAELRHKLSTKGEAKDTLDRICASNSELALLRDKFEFLEDLKGFTRWEEL